MICCFCMVSSRSALPENHELPRRGATLGSAGYAGDGDGEIAGESELSPIGIESRSALTAVTWDHMGQGAAFNFFGCHRVVATAPGVSEVWRESSSSASSVDRPQSDGPADDPDSTQWQHPMVPKIVNRSGDPKLSTFKVSQNLCVNKVTKDSPVPPFSYWRMALDVLRWPWMALTFSESVFHFQGGLHRGWICPGLDL